MLVSQERLTARRARRATVDGHRQARPDHDGHAVGGVVGGERVVPGQLARVSEPAVIDADRNRREAESHRCDAGRSAGRGAVRHQAILRIR